MSFLFVKIALVLGCFYVVGTQESLSAGIASACLGLMLWLEPERSGELDHKWFYQRILFWLVMFFSLSLTYGQVGVLGILSHYIYISLLLIVFDRFQFRVTRLIEFFAVCGMWVFANVCIQNAHSGFTQGLLATSVFFPLLYIFLLSIRPGVASTALIHLVAPVLFSMGAFLVLAKDMGYLSYSQDMTPVLILIVAVPSLCVYLQKFLNIDKSLGYVHYALAYYLLLYWMILLSPSELFWVGLLFVCLPVAERGIPAKFRGFHGVKDAIRGTYILMSFFWFSKVYLSMEVLDYALLGVSLFFFFEFRKRWQKVSEEVADRWSLAQVYKFLILLPIGVYFLGGMSV